MEPFMQGVRPQEITVSCNIIFWGRRQSQEYFSDFFYYLLHVSAHTGHLKVEYVLINSYELFMIEWIRCLGYQLYIYIYLYIYFFLVFCFGDFFAAVCTYVADINFYYYCDFLNIKLFY
jgi:hypothetical protein